MTGLRLLVVDDDWALLEALSGMLRLRLCAVELDTCDSAREAVTRIVATDYDVIVTDIKMPGMDGLTLLDEVRTIRPDTPVILITGHGEHDLTVRALRGGAYDFISKPLDRDYFEASLKRAIRTRELAREVVRQRAALERHAADLERTVEARTRELREANDAKDRLLLAEQTARRDAEAAQHRLAFLARASVRLSSSLDVEETCASVADLVRPELADWCAIEMLEGDRPVRPPETARTGAARLLPDVAAALRGGGDPDEPRLAPLQARGIVSWMSVPLASRGRMLGVACFGSTGRRYEAADLALAEDLGRRAALAIDNGRLYVEAQEAIRAREAFLARASHELRTPLTSVLATVRLLKRAISGELDEAPDGLIDMASRNLAATLAFIDALLDVSKLSSGRETLAMELVELDDLVQRAAELVAAQARDKSVALRLEIPPGLPIPGDRLKLEQVTINLFANAIKYSPPGTEVQVSAEVDGEDLYLRVRDAGEGITSEDLERVFEPFYQAGRRPSRRARGTGLGLAICKQIVELHGGAIWAESDGPGQGSTFTVRLRRQKARSPSAA